MPALLLTDEQAIDLVKQLPPNQQAALLQYLLTQQWPAWVSLSHDLQERTRTVAAQRGRDWDTMTEDEREAFVDDLVHEGR
jgi:hypothetical protein